MARLQYFYHLLLIVFSLVLPLHGTDPIGNYCNSDKDLTRSQRPSVDEVLSQLSARAAIDGFAVTAFGRGPRRIFGLVQCRQDVSTDDCSACADDAADEIQNRCPDEADARIWYDYCFLRYDSDSFIAKPDSGYGVIFYNVANINGNRVAFALKVGDLMNRLVKQASALPLSLGLGKDRTPFTAYVTIYGLVQCTRDLSQSSCTQCLAVAIGNFPKYCKSSKGCQVNYSSCRARYETYPFFFPMDSKNATTLVAKEGPYKRVLVYP